MIAGLLRGRNGDAVGDGRRVGKGKSGNWKNLSAAADGWTGDFGGIRRKNLRDLGSAAKQSDEIV